MNKVTRDEVEAALQRLEAVDMEAANLLRAHSDIVRFVVEKPLELRERLLFLEEFAKSLTYRLHELAIECEKWMEDE